MDAETNKYSYLSLNSLPSFVSSLGYNTDVITSALCFILIAS